MRVTSQPPVVEIRYPEPTGRPSLALRLGETFTALARSSADGLILEMGRHRLPARADVPISDGDRLTLRVAELTPRLTLKILDHRGPRPAIDAALREALPRQTTAGGWNSIVQSLGQGSTDLPPQASNALRQVLTQLPTPEQLQRPEGLRSALWESGVFLEARIAAAPELAAATAGTDTKALLARLAARLRALPLPSATAAGGRKRPPAATPQPATAVESLLRQTEGMVARLQSLQARAAAEPGALDLSFELPVRDTTDLEALRLRIRNSESDSPNGNDPESQPLTVDLCFQLTRAGTVHTKVRIQGNAVSTSWYAEQRPTAEAIAEALPELEHRLEAAGLAVGALSCAHGLPLSEGSDTTATLRERGLLHERA